MSSGARTSAGRRYEEHGHDTVNVVGSTQDDTHVDSHVVHWAELCELVNLTAHSQLFTHAEFPH